MNKFQPVKTLLLSALLAASGFASLALADTANKVSMKTVNTVAASDYSKSASWLCKPGREDACAVNLDTTVVAADGSMTIERHQAAADPSFDCFYVYPTVSFDKTGNSDMLAGPEEVSVIKGQFARFNAVCRTYAPLYRQVTLTALRARIAGQPMAFDRQLGYQDVAAAWHYYLQHHNNGRGVVLIGHSQGSGVLAELITREIDGQPIQKKIISAMLTGSRLAVPIGAGVGGQFKQVPLCESRNDIGCIITFASFRSDVPPPMNSRFGKVAGKGMVAACSNPAALTGGRGELHAYLSAGRADIDVGTNAIAPWVKGGTQVTTPFVSVPGMLQAECKTNTNGSYLSIAVNGDSDDARVDDIAGDVIIAGKVQANWGLHLIDMHLAIGNLIDIASTQAQRWSSEH